MNERVRSILDQVEHGEVSADEAAVLLREGGKGPIPELEEVGEEVGKMDEQAAGEKFPTDREDTGLRTHDVGAPVLTRQERLSALSERLHGWEPENMAGPEAISDGRRWPWPDAEWQWFWQNFEHPVYVDRTLDVAEGSELSLVLYQGNLILHGWNEPLMKFGAAVYDLRIGRDKETVRMAGSTGHMELWIPASIGRLDVKVIPGDIMLDRLSAKTLHLSCWSGDLRGEQVRGTLSANVRGGDVDVTALEGTIQIKVLRGDIRMRDVRSTQVDVSTSEGEIRLGLGQVHEGTYTCHTQEGDLYLYLAEGSACEISAVAEGNGSILRTTLPWGSLLKESSQHIHGVLRGGGASINVAATNGHIYIREMPSA